MPSHAPTWPCSNASTRCGARCGARTGPSSCATGSSMKQVGNGGGNRFWCSRSRPPRSSPMPGATSGAKPATSSESVSCTSLHSLGWPEAQDRRRFLLAPLVEQRYVRLASTSSLALHQSSRMQAGGQRKETPMNARDQHHFTTDLDTAALPAVVDRATWQAELDALRVREKAHTRAGDAIAATRRRLPMVAVDPTIQLVGPHGPVTLLEVFEGRRQLIVYFHM